MALRGDRLGDVFLSGLSRAGGIETNKEQLGVLQRQRKREQGQQLNNEFIMADVFTLDPQKGTEVNLEKLHSFSTQSYLDLVNSPNKGRAYYDADGNEVVGEFAGKPRQIQTEDGPRFILEIRKKNGEIVPVTLNRSSDPDDKPALVTQSQLELIYEGLFDNQIARNGISGSAVGKWRRDLIFDTAENQIKGIASSLLDDADAPPEAVISGIASLNEQIEQLNPSRGSQPTGLESIPVPTRQTSETEDEPQTTTDQRKSSRASQTASDETQQLIEQTGAPVSESEMQSANELTNDPGTLDQIANWWDGLSTTDKALLVSNGLLLVPGLGVGLYAGLQGVRLVGSAVFSKQAFNKIASLAAKTVTKPGAVKRTATRRNTNQPIGDAAKSMGLTDEATQTVNVSGRVLSPARAITTSTVAGGVMAGVNAIRGTGGEATQQTPVFNEGQTNAVFQIPNDPEKAIEWFANPKNQEFIKQLDQDTVQGVKTLLDDLEIKKKEDLVKAKQDGIISDANYRAASIMIATASSFDPQVQQNLYNALINEGETGNPSLTRDDLTKTSISAGNLALGRQRLTQDIIDDADISKQLIDSFTDASTIDDDGDRIFDGKYNKMLKSNVALVQDKIKQGTVLPKELTLLDAQIAEKIFARAQESSEDWKDWFLDWFRSSADVNGSLSTGFESLRVIRKSGGAIDRIVFTNLNASGSRSEAQESMTYQELVRLAGGDAEANYIITRTGG